MYLPSFWKLAMEANAFRAYYIMGYAVPVTAFGTPLLHPPPGVWIIYPSIYNWLFSSVWKPERGGCSPCLPQVSRSAPMMNDR